MARTEWKGKHFILTHTLEPEGPHPTQRQEHYDSFAFITALLCGRGTGFVEGNGYALRAGDLLAVGLRQLHACHFDQTGPHERMTLYFSPSILSPLWEYDLDLMRIFSGPPGIGNRYSAEECGAEEVGEILTKLCQMTDESAKENSPMREACAHLMVIRLLFLLYECYEKRELPQKPLGNDAVIWEICRFIHENLTEALDYQSLQKRFHVGRHHLSVLFRRNTGMTLTEFVLRKRLMRVSEEVEAGHSVSKAAEMAGFRNYSHFYKVFFKRHGISPKKYYASECLDGRIDKGKKG